MIRDCNVYIWNQNQQPGQLKWLFVRYIEEHTTQKNIMGTVTLIQ